MKYLALLAIAAMALSLGACSKDEPSYSTTSSQSATTTGYSK